MADAAAQEEEVKKPATKVKKARRKKATGASTNTSDTSTKSRRKTRKPKKSDAEAQKLPAKVATLAKATDYGHFPHDSVMQIIASQLPRGVDGGLLSHADTMAHTQGLVLPNLSQRHLFALRYLPLRRFLEISGPQHTCKTALAYEIMRIVLAHNGVGFTAENENKDSPKLRAQLWRYDPAFLSAGRFGMRYCKSLPETHAAAFFIMQKWAELAAKQEELTPPLCVLIDSLTGTAAADVIKEFEKEGYSEGRNFGSEARLNTQFANTVPQEMSKSPCILICIRHSKIRPAKMAFMPDERQQPGGQTVGFKATFAIEMYDKGFTAMAMQGMRKVRMVLRKNGMADFRREITVPFRWYDSVQPDGGFRRTIFWDWAAATTELLADLCAKKTDVHVAATTIGPLVREVAYVKHVPNTSKYVCENLGIEPVSATEMGWRIERLLPADKMRYLHDLLSIDMEYPAYEPAASFAVQQMYELNPMSRTGMLLPPSSFAPPTLAVDDAKLRADEDVLNQQYNAGNFQLGAIGEETAGDVGEAVND